MKKLLMFILDILFPPTNKELIIRKCTPESIPLHIQKHTTATQTTVTTLTEYTKLVRIIIHSLKYTQGNIAAKLLATLLTDFLITEFVENTLTPEKRYIIIPVPLSRKRQHKRGFDQIEKMLSFTNLPNTFTIETNLIARTRHTKSQTHLTRKERLTNVLNAFNIQQHSLLQKNAHYIIIDDVVTTGATLKEIQRILLQHVPRAHISLCALARA